MATPSNPWTGGRFKQLQAALLDAFPTHASLAQMVRFQFGKNLDAITGGTTLGDIIFHLTELATAEGWIDDLVGKAHEHNPGNPQLRFFMGLSSRAAEVHATPAPDSDAPEVGLSRPHTQSVSTTDSINIQVESVQTGEISNLLVPKRASVKWLVDKAIQSLGLAREFDAGQARLFSINWYLVEKQAEEEWKLASSPSPKSTDTKNIRFVGGDPPRFFEEKPVSPDVKRDYIKGTRAVLKTAEGITVYILVDQSNGPVIDGYKPLEIVSDPRPKL